MTKRNVLKFILFLIMVYCFIRIFIVSALLGIYAIVASLIFSVLLIIFICEKGTTKTNIPKENNVGTTK